MIVQTPQRQDLVDTVCAAEDAYEADPSGYNHRMMIRAEVAVELYDISVGAK